MPSIVQSEIAKNHIRLDINFPQDEVKDSLKKALAKEQKKSNLKGFRKGKAPLSTIKKMYGNQILTQLVFEELNSTITDFLRKGNFNYLGEPLPIDEDNKNDINIKSITDYSFSFELGLVPSEDLKGLNEDTKYEYYEIEVEEKEADEMINKWADQYGTHEDVDKVGEENDMLTVDLMELEKGKVKADGIELSTKVHIKSLTDDKLKKKLMGMKLGDDIEINIFDLAPDGDESHVRKYILDIDDEKEFNPEFKLGLEEVSRYKKAELNEEFFARIFQNEEVKTLEDAREKASEIIKNNKAGQANELLYKDVLIKILKLNMDMELPETFLKQWIEQSDDINVKDDAEYLMVLDDIKDSIIRNKLLETLGVRVEEKEITDAAYRQVYSYGIQDRAQAEQFVKQILGQKEMVDQISGNIKTSKLIDGIAKTVTKDIKKVSSKEFDDIFEAAVKAVQDKQKEEDSVKEEA